MIKPLAVLAAVVLLAGAASATTIGSDLIERGVTDTCIGCLFVYIPFPTSAIGQTVTSWGFFDNRAGANLITPVLFSGTGSALEVAAIGTTRTNAGGGAQTYDFGLVSGTAAVGANMYFGWRDGNAGGSIVNAGTIQFELTGGPGILYHTSAAGVYQFNGALTVGQAYTFSNQLTEARIYSADVTYTPEPAVFGLLGSGLLALVVAARRVKR
jgi:hypothetical protein